MEDFCDVDDLVRDSSWRTARQAVGLHGANIACLSNPPYAELIVNETWALVDSAPPASEDEHNVFLEKSESLNLKLGAITHAESMARIHPEVAVKVIEATKRFCKNVSLVDDLHHHSDLLRTEIRLICESISTPEVHIPSDCQPLTVPSDRLRPDLRSATPKTSG